MYLNTFSVFCIWLPSRSNCILRLIVTVQTQHVLYNRRRSYHYFRRIDAYCKRN